MVTFCLAVLEEYSYKDIQLFPLLGPAPLAPGGHHLLYKIDSTSPSDASYQFWLHTVQ